ncbi:dynamin family protein [Zhihengliuella salsuginis]|uniref:ABC transporter n=1 Tax=Zhihengliuella salsuginis TaxID=578222 RepID=A0ABQ3GJ93_9MICC|nr:dynamin family protein [Zhihengliuella salsuginis]GHD08200.1 ABC transporter [Zhihengliuella salsuginis]
MDAAHVAVAVETLTAAQHELSAARLPLALGSRETGEAARNRAIGQLRDHVIPRYQSLDAPLLAVVGGSTGAGKSTLVNALVGHPVTRAGAIRPTTRQPILLHHPEEAAWFQTNRVLPGLERIVGRRAGGEGDDGASRPLPSTAEQNPALAGSLVVLGETSIPRGLALLDAPDVDSIADENRRLAGQLLAAADLWLFVTTANRYADAVPWELLDDAARRDITVGVVLDRVPAEAAGEISSHLHSLLAERGLDDARLFVVEETRLDEDGMLPPTAVADVKDWLTGLASDAAARSEVARRTLAGAVDQVAELSEAVLSAEQDQLEEAEHLADIVERAFAQAKDDVSDAAQDGTLLRGEVLARWQDFVGTGEFFRSLETTVGRVRDRIGAFFTGKPVPVKTVEEAIETGLHAVIVDSAARATELVYRSWRATPAGRGVLDGTDVGRLSPDFSERTGAEVRAWQTDLMELIRTEGEGKRFTARMVSFGVNGVAVALMVVVFASTAGLTGLEVGIAGGSAVVGQKLLEAIFGEEAVRRLARKARSLLEDRVAGLHSAEAERFEALLTGVRDTVDVEKLGRAVVDTRSLVATRRSSAGPREGGDRA